jgi:hypothetical protein
VITSPEFQRTVVGACHRLRTEMGDSASALPYSSPAAHALRAGRDAVITLLVVAERHPALVLTVAITIQGMRAELSLPVDDELERAYGAALKEAA